MAAENSSSSETTGGCVGGGARKEIMLFGVRVVVDPMRKCVSLNNLSEYEQPEEMTKKIGRGGDVDRGEEKNTVEVAVAAGYVSADDAVPISSSSGGNRERKRGIPWTEEEHKLFLLGLHKVGKGDWKGISRNFVKTRTPTQVASHAQKYFLRRSNLNRRRRRSSLFDMTTETVSGMPMEEDQENATQLRPESNSSDGNPVFQMFPTIPIPIPTVNPTQEQTSHPQTDLVRLVPLTFQPPAAFNLSTGELVNSPSLSLGLSLASPGFSCGDSNSIIGVA